MLNSTQLAAAVRSNEQPRQLQAIGQALLGANSNGLAVVPGPGGVLAVSQVVLIDEEAPQQMRLVPPAGFRLVLDAVIPSNGVLAEEASPVEVLVTALSPSGALTDLSVFTSLTNPLLRPVVLHSGAEIAYGNGASPIATYLAYHYERIQPTDGLLALWPAGSLVDSIFQRTWTPAAYDYAYYFGQYDEMQRNGNGAFSYAAVLTLPALFDGSIYTLNKGSSQLVQVAGDGSGGIEVILGGTALTYTYTPGTPFLLLAVADGAEFYLSFDGVLLDSDEYTPFTDADSDGEFNRYDSSGATFGAFAMWNRALSAAEIAALGTGAAPNLPGV